MFKNYLIFIGKVKKTEYDFVIHQDGKANLKGADVNERKSVNVSLFSLFSQDLNKSRIEMKRPQIVRVEMSAMSARERRSTTVFFGLMAEIGHIFFSAF